jgi:hypothetical protein
LRYVVEFVDQELGHGFDEKDSIESDSPIPIPAVEEVVWTPSGRKVAVVTRTYWFMNNSQQPKTKVQLLCSELPTE